jgi:glycosyltransferase involved in cell wall biosynthesis
MKNILPVSFILTTLNEESTIEAFFQSLEAGSTLPAEIVICDGGSSDRTIDILRNISIDGVSIIVMQENGATIARGRNTAINRCSYEILAISDAGCTLDNDWLTLITAPLLDSEEVDVVSGGYRYGVNKPFHACAAAAEIDIRKRPIESFLPSSRSFALRKKAFNEAGQYPEYLSFAGEDTFLCLELKRQGKNFYPQLDAQVTWYPRSNAKSYIKQHFLYGVGDGESGSNKARYTTLQIKLLLFVGFCVSIVVQPWCAFAAPLGLLIYYYRLYPKYDWKKVPLTRSLCAFALVLIKDAATLIGYAKGRTNKISVTDK